MLSPSSAVNTSVRKAFVDIRLCPGLGAAPCRITSSILLLRAAVPGRYLQTHRTGNMRRIATSSEVDRATVKKDKGSPYSITERRIPELIPVLDSQPSRDVSHKPGGR